MTGARLLGAAVLTTVAASLLAVEGLSWQQSARFGPLTATSYPCAVRLDALGPADLAAGLRVGDSVLLRDMDVASRTAGVFHYTPTQAGRAGQATRIVVQRGSGRLTIPYTLRHTDSATTFAAQLGFKLVLFAIALLLLWRGTDRASLILGIWCCSVGIGLPDAWWGLLPLWGRVAGGALTAVLWTCSPFFLYLVIDAVATGVSVRARIICQALMVALMLPALIITTVDATAQAVTGCWLISITPWYANTAFAAQQLVIVAFFVLSYLRTTGLAKQRVRWVFWAFLFSRAGVLLNLVNRLVLHPLHLSGVEWATVLLFPIGCTYAILRHRIIDVNFVLSRTLVYTILTTIVVGVFILAEELLQTVEAGHGVSIAVEVIIALGIGLWFNALHKRVASVIERALFRAKHEAANALRRLAEEAPFTESASALLRRATDDVRSQMGAAATAVYERSDGTFRLTAQSGTHEFAEIIGADDLALVRMRKTRSYVGLGELSSALGYAGVAFPFVLRGQLAGVFICLPRPNGEAYDPDEIALLASVTHEVGVELNAIRARRQSELLDALVAGSLDIGQVRSQLES